MLPLSDTERQRWMVELQQAEAFRDTEFGTYRKEGKTTKGAGIHLDLYEYGASVQEEDKRAPINLVFVLAKAIVPLLFPQQPRVLALPTRPQDAAMAPVAASLLNHYNAFLNLKATNQQAVFDTWLLGYGVTKVGYLSDGGMDVGRTEQETKQRLRDKLKRKTEEVLVGLGLKKPTPAEDETPVVTDTPFHTTDNPYVRWVDPFAFCIDPRARSIEEADWVSETTRRTLHAVKATTRYSQARFSLDPAPPEDVQLPSSELERFQSVDVHEIHYRNPKSPNGITILILGQAKGQWATLYHEHSVYTTMRGWQYDLLAFNKHNHKLYPISDVAQIRPLLSRLNNSFEAILEQVDKFVSKILLNVELVHAEGQLAAENGTIGAIVKCHGDVNNAMRVINMDQVKQDLLVLVEKVIDLIILVTGMTRAELTGLSTAQTATEAQIGQGGARNRRIDQGDAVLEFLNQQVEKLWAVIRQFVDVEEQQLLVGQPTYEDETGLPRYDTNAFLPTMDPQQQDALQHGEYRFKIELTSMQRPNLEILRKQVENLIVVLTNQGLNQQLAQQGKMLDVAEGLRVALRLYPELIADVNRIIRPVTPPVAQGLGQGNPQGPGAAESVRQAPTPNYADLASAAAGEKGMGTPGA